MITTAILLGERDWQFEHYAFELQRRLKKTHDVKITNQPAEFNFVVSIPKDVDEADVVSFIPLPAIHAASDKRTLARIFAEAGVPTPKTYLMDSCDEVMAKVNSSNDRWILKYPTACGGAGHQVLEPGCFIAVGWEPPYLLQRLVPQDTPEVYRIYSAGGELFGWNVRRFAPSPGKGKELSPIVSHARGAHYELLGKPPQGALEVAEAALRAVGLFDTFGCADLVHDPVESWVDLEVGTDGIYEYIDRAVPEPLKSELWTRCAHSFWRAAIAYDKAVHSPSGVS